ncbi:MAG: hypothetical protein UHU19_16505 [Lachnospiraceae bacterium]|nr:hypothetical protein [Lachnospiraceae bacterium]
MIAFYLGDNENTNESLMRYIKLRLMRHFLFRHIEKYGINKWSHGYPMELVTDEDGIYIKYEDGVTYRYDDFSEGAEGMDVQLVTNDEYTKVKEKYEKQTGGTIL